MLTDKEIAEKRRIDRKVAAGTATRKEVLRGLQLQRKRGLPLLEKMLGELFKPED
jgi:hypothetical protein